MHLIGYIRVSTDEQANGHGLNAQLDAIERACELRGDELDQVFQDVLSGSGRDREGLSAALTALLRASESSRQDRPQGLIVARLDRLTRSLLHFSELMARSKAEGWALIALDLGVDTSTPQGALIANVMASFAEFERQLISERTRAGLRAARDRGVVLGRPTNVSEETVALIKRLRRRKLSYAKIAARLNDDRVPTGQGAELWKAGTVGYLLRR